jgi:adhesin/invasin
MIAVAASTGAALVSVITALYSYGVVGKSESHQAIGNFGAAWVGLQPTIETASAIGETTHFAATIADKNGSILVGAHPTWTTGDTNVAVVLQDGSVIARGPGATLVSVVVGSHVAHSRLHVKQKVAVVEIANAASDSGIVVSEGSQVSLKARALDARGHEIAGAHLEWQVDDSSVAALDGPGSATLVGKNAGRTMVGAKLDDVTGHTGVTVVTVASGLALVAGTDQRAIAGSTLPQPIVVRATNRKGAPAAGQLVSFRLPADQGAVQPATAFTDADGRARTTWTLGENPGRQRLLASVARVDSAIAVVAEADPVVANTRVVAVTDHPSGRAGDKLAEPISVRVTDSAGRALADVPVRWTALDGGTVEATTPRTDSMGVARARWTLAKKTGTQRARAEVGGPGARGIAPVTIGATAMAGEAVGITIVRGDNQRTAAGAELPNAVVIKVVDANGSGVADAEVVFSPSGGVVPDSAVRTDSLGVVRTRWTMGHMAKDYSLAVHVNGVKKLFKLTAHAVPAAAANLSFDDAPAPSSKSKGASAKVKHLYVLVTDVYGNPVPDAKVGFSATSGVVAPARAVSDSKGRAALVWTLGAKPGEQTLSGAVRRSDVRGAYVTQVAEHAPAKGATKATPRPAAPKHAH